MKFFSSWTDIYKYDFHSKKFSLLAFSENYSENTNQGSPSSKSNGARKDHTLVFIISVTNYDVKLHHVTMSDYFSLPLQDEI